MGNTALDAALNAQFFVQIGIFTAVPMIMGFILELGLLKVWILSGVIFIYNVGFCHFVLLKLVFLFFCFAFTCTNFAGRLQLYYNAASVLFCLLYLFAWD